MKLAGDYIGGVADRLAEALDPAKPYMASPALTFLSWSEDPEVARWFACSRSVVEPRAAANDALRDRPGRPIIDGDAGVAMVAHRGSLARRCFNTSTLVDSSALVLWTECRASIGSHYKHFD